MVCPESPKRYEVLAPSRIFEGGESFKAMTFNSFNANILEAVHDKEYIVYVRDAYKKNVQRLDAYDTVVTKDVFDQALLSASAACHAVDKIFKGEITRAFCAVRPPGHHANRYRALGFCVFNNVAIAAKYAQNSHGIKRILIVDWDVHPGNGTQEIFFDDPSVFTLSFHQDDLFPETGKENLIGQAEGKGFNRNVAFAKGTPAQQYVHRFESVVKEVVQNFKPELVFISAGFDAHKNDPVARMELLDDNFVKMTEIVLQNTAPFTQGRIISILEGGYNLGSLHTSVKAHCKSLATYSIAQKIM